MNLRIDGNRLRFKISRIELENLCDGQAVWQMVPMPQSEPLTIEITAIQDTEPALTFKATSAAWTLSVKDMAARELLRTLPRRDGLKVDQDDLQLSLAVDIRTQRTSKA